MMLTDLSHKRKTVSDLIRFIGNTTEYLESPERVNTPNYSILLGAGASVTSGIRSEPTLTLADMKEITGISIAAIQKLLDLLIHKKYVERGEKDGSWRMFVTQ